MNKKEDQYQSTIIDHLNKTHENNDKQLYDICNYVGFGILIAIFFMDAKFRVRNKCLVLFSSVFAIFSLFLNYVLSAYYLNSSDKMLRNSNQNGLDAKYREMENCSDYPYWTTQGVLVAAVILFCILGYRYFFDVDPQSKKSNSPKS